MAFTSTLKDDFDLSQFGTDILNKGADLISNWGVDQAKDLLGLNKTPPIINEQPDPSTLPDYSAPATVDPVPGPVKSSGPDNVLTSTIKQLSPLIWGVGIGGTAKLLGAGWFTSGLLAAGIFFLTDKVHKS